MTDLRAGVPTDRAVRPTMVFPGTWVNIPLDTDAQTEQAITALIKRQVGRDDRLARLRRDVKDRLRLLAVDAKKANAVQLALSLEILPGLPFPASLVSDYRDWPDYHGDGGEDGRTIAERLDALLPGGEVLELQSGIAIRTFNATTISPGSEKIPDIKLEYFLCVPTGEFLLHVVADVPVLIDPELVAMLFDAMIDSVRWSLSEAAVESRQ
jgi:hypothetical protein